MHMYIPYSEILTCMYTCLCEKNTEKVQNTVCCFMYMDCSLVQVQLLPYVDVIMWPCAVVPLIVWVLNIQNMELQQFQKFAK